MLTVRQVAVLLNVSSMNVYRRVESGELRAYRIGRTIRVRSDDLEAYMRAAKVVPS